MFAACGKYLKTARTKFHDSQTPADVSEAQSRASRSPSSGIRTASWQRVKIQTDAMPRGKPSCRLVGGPPPHIHSPEEESFFVLEGEITFQVGADRFMARAGTFCQHAGRQPAQLHERKRQKCSNDYLQSAPPAWKTCSSKLVNLSWFSVNWNFRRELLARDKG